MTALVGLSGLAFVDSLNVFNIGSVWAIVHQARANRRSPYPAALSFIAGQYAVGAVWGIGVVVGLSAVAQHLHVDVSPGVRYAAELILGALLITAACLMPANSRGKPSRWTGVLRDGRPWFLGTVGVGTAATQVPLSLPYMTLLGAMIAHEPLPGYWPLAVLGYCAAVQALPLLALALATARTRWARRLQRVFATAVVRFGRTALRVLIGVLGVALVADALIHQPLW